MGRSRTINLTRAREDNHIEEVLKLPHNYDDDIAARCVVKRQYFEQKQLAERTYAEKFKKLHEGILRDVHRFVEKCLDVHDEHLFVGNEAESIFGSIVNLDMQISDHEPTFNLIESSLKKHKNLHVTRVSASSIRKRNLLEMLEPSKQSKRTLIMVEQAETLSRSLTDILVGHLKNRITDVLSPTTVIMVLFCLSTHIQELPFDHVNCFGRMDTIEKDRISEQREVLEELIRSREIRMKLGCGPLNYIYEYFVNVDASMASVIYLCSYAMFEYYYDLEDSYEQMDEVTRSACFKSTATINRHQYLCDQMYYFTELLCEKGLYPEDVTDIYEDMNKFDRLDQSIQFVDSVKNLRKFPQEALMRRIDAVILKSQQTQNTKNGKVDVISILSKYKEKILNNKGCEEIITQLTDDLLKHAYDLGNPIKEDRDHIYFNNLNSLTESTLTAVRLPEKLIKYFCRDGNYFGVLLRQHILTSQGQIGVHDLAADVSDEYRKIIRSERSCVIKKGPRIKITPKKRGSRVSKALQSELEPVQRGLSPEEEDGLAKAIFVDVIDCMELQYLIKLDPKVKGRHLKRLIWPILD